MRQRRSTRTQEAPALAAVTTRTEGQAIDDFSASILAGRPSLPADIVGTTAFLASAASDYITGQTLMVDGPRFAQEWYGTRVAVPPCGLAPAPVAP